MSACGHRRCGWQRNTAVVLLFGACASVGYLAASLPHWQPAAWSLTAAAACAGAGIPLLLATCPDPMPGELPRRWTPEDWNDLEREVNR